ncbi:MAG: CHY zinc finger protein [Acidobacteriota bacterium]
MICPKCAFEQPVANECLRCGVVFAKWDEAQDFPRSIPPPRWKQRGITREVREDTTADGRIGRSEWLILGSGLAGAATIYVIPLTRFAFSALVTLFHEFGHAVVGWSLGYPSLPAFDFVYGGGFTHRGSFHLSIALAVVAGFGFLAWWFRKNPRTVAVLGSIFVLWFVAVSSEWRREILIASAGHAFEFILAGIFFYQALSGYGLRSPDFERPLAAFAAFFVQIHSMLFALRLQHDPEFLAWYREGKGGALMNDLEEVALDLQIHFAVQPGIVGVAKMLFVFSFIPISLALVWYFFRARWHRLLQPLLEESQPTQ